MPKSKIPVVYDENGKPRSIYSPNRMPRWADEMEIERTDHLITEETLSSVRALMKKQAEQPETDATPEGRAEALRLGDLRRSRAARALLKPPVLIRASLALRKNTPKK